MTTRATHLHRCPTCEMTFADRCAQPAPITTPCTDHALDPLAMLKRLYEAARVMADPEHCLHATRAHLPWRALAEQAQAAIRAAEGR